LALASAANALTDIRAALGEEGQTPVELELSGVTYCDSAGAAVICDTLRMCQQVRRHCRIVGTTPVVQGLLDLLDLKALAQPKQLRHAPQPGILERLGGATLTILSDLRTMLYFVDDMLAAAAYAVVHPRALRARDVWLYLDRVGVDAVPIVVTIHFLLGVTLAFLGANQLRQFGANIYVADLIGIAMVQELGPIMTAVLLAGRSGAAFAAEIGTMKVAEEVDALIAMGFDPYRFLVIPKVLAAVIAVPCLLVLGTVTGIVGGGLIAMNFLEVSVDAYCIRLREALTIWMFVQGMIKALAFSLLVAGVGCMRGLQVRGGAESVGRYTTSAVVSGIFLIIIANAVFTIVFQTL
jgi:phospholipid/cholesterol/gamma-HCH transport system permease protein